MRLPSIDQLIADASASVRRFPYVVLAAVLSALIPMSWLDGANDVLAVLTRSGNGDDLLVASTLALPLYFSVRLAQERRLVSATLAIVLRVAFLAGLLGFVWQWSGWSEQARVIHYMQLSAGAHLLAAFIPFVRRGELNAFWQYNRTLFLRALITAIYAAVLYAGLSIALVAIEQLFAVDWYDEVYLDLFLVIGFVFVTWFAVSGVPRDIGQLESVEDYPRGLKLFAQFVLVPLVTVYLAILTAYFVKVLITTEWPSGWIGWLVSSVSVVGILSILLTHPIRDRAENKWIASYSRWFWLVMIPAILMLLFAIWKRIAQYGITEPRYFLVVLTVWLAAMAVLYGIVRSQNIKLLPLSLCIVALVTFGGPWGAYSVSRGSQTDRFVSLLENNGMIEDGRAIAAPSEVSRDDRRELSGSLTYLLASHGTGHMTALLGPELAATDSVGRQGALRQWEAGERASAILEALGVEYVAARRAETSFFTYRVDASERMALGGYDYVFKTRANDASIAWGAGDSLQVVLVQDEARLELKDANGDVLVDVPLADMLTRARDADERRGFDPSLPREVLRVDAVGSGIRVTLFIDSVRGERTAAGPRVNGIAANWLVEAVDEGVPTDSSAATPE